MGFNTRLIDATIGIVEELVISGLRAYKSSTSGGLPVITIDDGAGGSVIVSVTGKVYSTTIGCRAYHNVNQSVANNTYTALALNSERWDSDAFHSTASNTSRLTVPTGLGGKYLIFGHAQFESNNAGLRELVVRLNGGTFLAVWDAVPNASFGHSMSIATVYDLAAADYAELWAYQNSGGALNVNTAGNYSAEFGMVRLGA